MNIFDIWMVPTEQRTVGMFIERWKELAEQMGNRTMRERLEMAEIADAVMPELIAVWEKSEYGVELDKVYETK